MPKDSLNLQAVLMHNCHKPAAAALLAGNVNSQLPTPAPPPAPGAVGQWVLQIAACTALAEVAALPRVCTVNQLLLAEVNLVAGVRAVVLNQQLGLNGGHSSKGEAGTAAALVLGGRHLVEAAAPPVPAGGLGSALGRQHIPRLDGGHKYLLIEAQLVGAPVGTKVEGHPNCLGADGKCCNYGLHIPLEISIPHAVLRQHGG